MLPEPADFLFSGFEFAGHLILRQLHFYEASDLYGVYEATSINIPMY